MVAGGSAGNIILGAVRATRTTAPARCRRQGIKRRTRRGGGARMIVWLPAPHPPPSPTPTIPCPPAGHPRPALHSTPATVPKKEWAYRSPSSLLLRRKMESDKQRARQMRQARQTAKYTQVRQGLAACYCYAASSSVWLYPDLSRRNCCLQ